MSDGNGNGNEDVYEKHDGADEQTMEPGGER